MLQTPSEARHRGRARIGRERVDGGPRSWDTPRFWFVAHAGRRPPCWRRPVPNTPARKKQMRQDDARRARNRWRKRTLKERTKDFMTAIHDRDVEKAETAFRAVQKELDRVSTTSTIHKNHAARRKSRLSRRLRDLKTSAG